jgi:predicted ATP-dependent endonuclease of OLD family
MQITGTIRTIRDTQQISEKFQKKEFIVETQGQYKQTIQIELQGDKCDIIDAYVVGEEVVCDININGRIWLNPQGEEKCFNTIVAWKIQRSENQQENSTPATSTQTSPKEYPQANQPNSFVDESDDLGLPF